MFPIVPYIFTVPSPFNNIFFSSDQLHAWSLSIFICPNITILARKTSIYCEKGNFTFSYSLASLWALLISDFSFSYFLVFFSLLLPLLCLFRFCYLLLQLMLLLHLCIVFCFLFSSSFLINSSFSLVNLGSFSYSYSSSSFVAGFSPLSRHKFLDKWWRLVWLYGLVRFHGLDLLLDVWTSFTLSSLSYSVLTEAI